jgi:uncharacterized protein (TIGR02300 family)
LPNARTVLRSSKIRWEIIINTAVQNTKALRGTKRVCQGCETRFYDLARDRIVCPSCGADYKVTAAPAIGVGRAAPTGKTGWRSKPQRLPKPPVPMDDQEEVVPEIAADAADEAPDTGADDDLVLEQEPDDGDVSNLIEHTADEPKTP